MRRARWQSPTRSQPKVQRESFLGYLSTSDRLSRAMRRIDLTDKMVQDRGERFLLDKFLQKVGARYNKHENETEGLQGEENWLYKDVARGGGGTCWLERAG
jgi:hypothetical protein